MCVMPYSFSLIRIKVWFVPAAIYFENYGWEHTGEKYGRNNLF